MTQEQKGAVRTREEQVGAIANDWIITGMGRDVAHEWAAQVVKEAEARGAEEVRRGDAEACKPIYQIEHEDGVWHEYFPGFWKVAEYPDDRKRILYTRPANVAALEARVKVLEVALAAAAKVAVEHGNEKVRMETALVEILQMPARAKEISGAALTREGGV